MKRLLCDSNAPAGTKTAINKHTSHLPTSHKRRSTWSPNSVNRHAPKIHGGLLVLGRPPALQRGNVVKTEKPLCCSSSGLGLEGTTERTARRRPFTSAVRAQLPTQGAETPRHAWCDPRPQRRPPRARPVPRCAAALVFGDIFV